LTYFVGSIRERSVYLFEKNCDLNSQMTKYEIARRLLRNSKRNNSVITLFHNFHTSLSQCLNHGWLKNRHLLKCNAMSVMDGGIHVLRHFLSQLIMDLTSVHQCYHDRLFRGYSTIKVAESSFGRLPIENRRMTGVR